MRRSTSIDHFWTRSALAGCEAVAGGASDALRCSAETIDPEGRPDKGADSISAPLHCSKSPLNKMKKDSLRYLKEEVYFEPLFNRWYAWPYLISPAQASRYVVNTHLRLMKSFVANHKLHIMISAEPGMAGGDYMNCGEEQVDRIRQAISDIDTECKELVALSQAIDGLDELLRNHTSGETIEPLYHQIPTPLKGYVELTLDSEHRAGYRLLEALLYKSPHYKRNLQSASFGILSGSEVRPFVLSTPRLPDDKNLQLTGIGFDSPILQRILQSREVPLDLEEIATLFAGCSTEGGLPYEELFTATPPSRLHAPVAEGVRLQYVGHAGFLIETANLAILVDPVIAVRSGLNADEVISFSELPKKIDYVCLTHSHQDHVNIETLLQLRYKIGQVLVPKSNGGSLVDPSLRLMLKQFGFNVTECDDLDEIDLPGGGKITSIPFFGEHGDLNIRSKTAWHFDLAGTKMLFGADSSNIDPTMYEHVHKHIGDLDVIAIGMECVGAPFTWLYGALYTKSVSRDVKNSRRLNGCDMRQAHQIVNLFKAKQVFVYALGMEPWYKYFMGIDYDDDSKQIVESKKMVAACNEAGIPALALYGKHTLHLK